MRVSIRIGNSMRHTIARSLINKRYDIIEVYFVLFFFFFTLFLFFSVKHFVVRSILLTSIRSRYFELSRMQLFGHRSAIPFDPDCLSPWENRTRLNFGRRLRCRIKKRSTPEASLWKAYTAFTLSITFIYINSVSVPYLEN